jgi:hypothetical protein
MIRQVRRLRPGSSASATGINPLRRKSTKVLGKNGRPRRDVSCPGIGGGLLPSSSPARQENWPLGLLRKFDYVDDGAQPQMHIRTTPLRLIQLNAPLD